jgi:hypothetical protein
MNSLSLKHLKCIVPYSCNLILLSIMHKNTTSRHTYSIVADILQKCHINYWCIKLPSVFEGVLDTTLCDKVLYRGDQFY